MSCREKWTQLERELVEATAKVMGPSSASARALADAEAHEKTGGMATFHRVDKSGSSSIVVEKFPPLSEVPSNDILLDILGLVLSTPPPMDVIQSWTDEQKAEAEKWAATEHVRASDNDHIVRRTKPDFLKEYT